MEKQSKLFRRKSMKLTVGRLKELIKNLPDDTPVVSRDNNYELHGAITEMSDYGVSVKKFSKEKQWFRDDFDGTPYSHDVFVQDEEKGKEMLCI